MISRDTKVWVATEQRLDGLTSRWGSDAFIRLETEENDQITTTFISLDVAKQLARGLNKAIKRAAV